jgi:predicted secreted protein
MAFQGGYGVVLKIRTAPSTLTTVAKVLDVDIPPQILELADVTNHASTGGYREFLSTGVRELGEFPATLLWDDTDTSHAKILSVFAANAAVDLTVQDPAGQEIIAFAAFVRQISRMAKIGEAYKCQVTLRPTGQPTIT